jgi:hypothetical protein
VLGSQKMQVLIVSVAGVLGTIILGIAVLRVASTTIRRIEAAFAVFGWHVQLQGSCSPLPSCTFALYPIFLYTSLFAVGDRFIK